MAYAVSNPLAIVNTLDARSRQYDVNIKAGFNYKMFPGFSLGGVFGLYYNYNKEHILFRDVRILPLFLSPTHMVQKKIRYEKV